MTPKPQRNDPCPCGSGKKFKSCCWSKQQPGVKKKFKATLISSGPQDLIQRTIRMANAPHEKAPQPEITAVEESQSEATPKQDS